MKLLESVWEAPKEGYMTIEEYNRLNLVYEAKTEQQLHEESKFMRENADELASKYRREQLKAVRASALQREAKEKEIERESYTACEEVNEVDEEPGASARPFGKWQTVVRKYVLQSEFLCINISKVLIWENVHFFVKGKKNQSICNYQPQRTKITVTWRQ